MSSTNLIERDLEHNPGNNKKNEFNLILAHLQDIQSIQNIDLTKTITHRFYIIRKSALLI